MKKQEFVRNAWHWALGAIACVAMVTGAWAEPAAEVISADGTATNQFETLEAAWGDLDGQGNGITNTVRLLRNVEGNLWLNDGNATTLDLNGWTLTGTNATDSVITINPNAALTLTDTSAEQTGKVTMLEGVAGPMFGGGVWNCGMFTMSGGAIMGCTAATGGGVWNNGTFTMSGGMIADCKATGDGGGVYNKSNFTFTMMGGAIADCTAQHGGGVFNDGSFTMMGGAIADCTAQYGGGVFNDGSFTMLGGKVANEIYKATGTIEISGGLFGNEAKESFEDDWLAPWTTLEGHDDSIWTWQVTRPELTTVTMKDCWPDGIDSIMAAYAGVTNEVAKGATSFTVPTGGKLLLTAAEGATISSDTIDIVLSGEVDLTELLPEIRIATFTVKFTAGEQVSAIAYGDKSASAGETLTLEDIKYGTKIDLEVTPETGCRCLSPTSYRVTDGIEVTIDCTSVAEENTHLVNTANFAANRTLADGHLYIFTENVEYTATDTESAMTVESGTAHLYIPSDVTVTLRGGDASGAIGAGAGIEVTEGAGLYVFGEGMLVATGGAAAGGCDGENASASWVNDQPDGKGKDCSGAKAPDGTSSLYFTSGAGGAGGAGGGGAGAGIGGRGGNGGAGGAGGAAQTKDWTSNTFVTDGDSGAAGSRGGAGGIPGEISIAETVSVMAKSGAAEACGGKGGVGSGVSFTWWGRYWGAWGGGGGGGGGAGGAAVATGIGGAGGNGGGGGGAGAIDRFGSPERFLSHDQYGRGGAGGLGMTGFAAGNGESGTNACGETIKIDEKTGQTGSGYDVAEVYARPGFGGAGVAGSDVLPAGFTQVEYIESTKYVESPKSGGQYIDTGYVPTVNARIVADFNPLVNYGGYLTFFGVEADGDTPSSGIILRYADNVINGWFCNDDATAVQFSGLENTRIAAELKADSIKLNRTTAQFTTTGTPCELPIYIFCCHDGSYGGGWARRFQAMRLYSFKIYEGEEPKRDFVPCVVKATGEAGLFDLVEGKFYNNRGSNAFVAGREVERVEFYDPIRDEAESVAALVVTKDTATFDDGGWYVVTGKVTRGTITVSGTANLILADGAKLTVNGGIRVEGSNALNIYGQSAGTGALIANGKDRCAGIGSGAYATGGIVTINGGVVTATGDVFSAGIGCGERGEGCTVSINGGTVTAQGGQEAEGIGGGYEGASGMVKLDARKVVVVDGAVGNGSSYVKIASRDDYAVVMAGVHLEHTTTVWTSGDGSKTNAINGSSFAVLKGTENVKVIINVDPEYEVVGGKQVYDLGTVNEDCAPEFDDLPQLTHRKVEYVDEYGQLLTNDTFTIVTKATDKFENDCWYLVEGTVSCGSIDVVKNGMANLILADGASLTVTGNDYYREAGIEVNQGETLNIYGQRGGTGQLTVTGGDKGAGIGGCGFDGDDDGGTVTINGGVVTAKGGDNGAGIGGGSFGSGGKVTINGGVVTATGKDKGAGIGGGGFGSGGKVTINGGTVTATGGERGAGIGGGGDSSSDGEVNWDSKRVKIDDGDVGSGHSYVKFVEIWVGPTCEGGEIAEGAGGVWFVTPASGVTEVTVRNLPEGALVAVPPTIARVVGVTDAQIRIYDGEDDVTDEYFVNDGKIVKAVTASFTLGEYIASVSYTTTDPNVESGEATADFALKVLPGTVITLEVVCEAGCHYDGETTWTANADLSVDLKVTSFDFVEVISADGAMTNIYTSLQAALDDVGTGASETNTVRLLRNVEGNVEVKTDTATILDLNGYTLMGSGEKSVITINPDAALTLTDTSAEQTGKVTMPEGMAGPTSGGGVYNYGTFTMSGGTIAGCEATNSGGGVFNGGTFTMSGGTIAGCTTTMFGGGVFNSSNSTFTMLGGTIAGCEATHAGGVYNYDTVMMTGGTIAGCKATVAGGGVFNYAAGCTFTMTGGTIADCTAMMSGGGVKYNGGTFTMTGGAVKDAIDGVGNCSISGGLFGEAAKVSFDVNWLAEGAVVEYNPDPATDDEYPKVVRGGDNFVVMVRTEGLESLVVSNGIEAVAGYPAAGYRIFEVAAGAEITFDYEAAEGYAVKADALTTLTVNADTVIYPTVATSPTCEGGTIVEGVDGVWFVTPNAGVTEVTVRNLPEEAFVAVPTTITKVNGVNDGQIRIYDQGNDVTGIYLIENGVISRLETYLVTVKCPGLEGLVSLEGSEGYMTNGIYTVKNDKGENCVYLWLPDGMHWFTLSDGTTTNRYCAIMKGVAITVEPLPVGFFVNGVDIGEKNVGPGWFYFKGTTLLLDGAGPFVLSGVATNNEVQIQVKHEADGATVVLSNAIVFTENRQALDVRVAGSASLLMAGGTSYLAATSNAAAVSVGVDSALAVGLEPGADASESMIGVFNYGDAKAISGSGTVAVSNGTFFVWSNGQAVQTPGTFTCGTGEVLMTGETPETLRYVGSCDTNSCVLVCPGVTVTPGKPVGPFTTAVAATNVMKKAVLNPLDDVTAKLGAGSSALEAYCNMFGFAVTGGDESWFVEALLTPEAWSNVVESARSATRQIPVADIAKLGLGDVLEKVPLTNCVPGFYYSLYDGSSVTNLKADINENNGNILCGPDTTVTIPVLSQPAPASGFFTIDVLEIPTVYVPGSDHILTGSIYEVPGGRRLK